VVGSGVSQVPIRGYEYGSSFGGVRLTGSRSAHMEVSMRPWYGFTGGAHRSNGSKVSVRVKIVDT
jgi:hypothetical protein